MELQLGSALNATRPMWGSGNSSELQVTLDGEVQVAHSGEDGSLEEVGLGETRMTAEPEGMR